MVSEGRVITRTRPSLSCLPCKRRKVKCEKQRPACRYCRRLNDHCVYEPFPSQAKDSGHGLNRLGTSPEQGRHAAAEATKPSSPATRTEPPPGTPRPRDGLHWFPDTDMDAGLDDAFLMDESDLTLFDEDEDLFGGRSSIGLDSYPASTASSTHPGISAPDDFSLGHASSATSLSPHSFDPPSRDPRWGTPTMDPRPAVVDKSKFFSKWALGNPVENAEEAASLARQIPEKQDGFKLLGCLSSPQGDLRRYVGSPFWALAGNRMADCDLLLQAQQLKFQSKKFDERCWTELSNVMRSLPSKKLCDVLLRSFLLSVRPLLPLVHGPTFQAEYDAFWSRYSRNAAAPRPEDAMKDASFLCLLWAVLYSGAVAASPSLFAEAQIQVRDTTAFLCRLKGKLDETLLLSKYTELPTLNGLVASLLAQECDPKVDEILTAPTFVSQTMQAARTLGLHREDAVMARGEIEGEVARRVWYHILYLEVLATISSGSSLSYSTSEDCFSTCMPHEFNDASMGASRLSLDSTNRYAQTSTAMLLAIGRYEMSRVMRHVIEQCYNNRVPTKEDLGILVAEMEQFESKIDGAIARLEVRGIPEQGHISTQLLGANPLIHKRLYQDNPHEETVFNSLARIQLSMMKNYVSIFFNRQFLNQASNHQTSKIWSSEIVICSEFLRNYLHLARLPAFSPYRWFCPGKMQPLQECLIILTYLKGHPQDGDSHLLRYLLSEIFDIFKVGDEADDDDLSLYRTIRRYEAPWQMLRQMRDEVIARLNSGDRSWRRGHSRQPGSTGGAAPTARPSQSNFLGNRPNFPAQTTDQALFFAGATPTTAPPRASVASAPFPTTLAAFERGSGLDPPGNALLLASKRQDDHFRPPRHGHGQPWPYASTPPAPRDTGPMSAGVVGENDDAQLRSQTGSTSSHAEAPSDDMPDDWNDILQG